MYGNSSIINCFNSMPQFYDCTRSTVNYASYFGTGVFTSSIFAYFVKGEPVLARVCNGLNMISIGSALSLSHKEQNVKIQCIALVLGISSATIAHCLTRR